jgi:fatty-acyl-CoA synthase
MMGLMMEAPMLLSNLIDYAARHHGATEVVSLGISGEVERDSWRGMQRRSKRLAKALQGLGWGADSRVATLAWNTLDHLETYYAALGIGVPLHTLNPRLAASDLQYMVQLVEDTACFIDGGTIAIAEALAPLCPKITTWIYLDRDGPAPAHSLSGLIHRSELVADLDDDFDWPVFDERRASTICFTSGTTGRPKGVVYSHRSLTLTAMNMTMADMYATERTGELVVAMPIAPMFHANAWIMPFSSAMNGHKLVMSGRAFDAPTLTRLMVDEGVTILGAVPTVLADIFRELDRTGKSAPALTTLLVAGTRIPASLFDAIEARGLAVRQTWGMTEAPGATRSTHPAGTAALPADAQRAVRLHRQGRVAFQADMRIVDAAGEPLPHDGIATGILQVRGPTIVARYLGEPPEAAVEWLDTGDIARLHPDSTLEIVDRAKDVIKSGGEWISSPQLESAAMEHPAVMLAAVIAVPHPRWEERPLLLCRLKEGASVSADELRAFMAPKVAKWWLPERVEFVESLPLTSTGKLNKLALREEIRAREKQDWFAAGE